MVRNSRGLQVPGINTTIADEKLSFALSYHGQLTPPQSAHESRRPSLASSLWSDQAYSASSSLSAFSQPSTPVYAPPQAEDSLFAPQGSSALHGNLVFDALTSYRPSPEDDYYSPENLSLHGAFGCSSTQPTLDTSMLNSQQQPLPLHEHSLLGSTGLSHSAAQAAWHDAAFGPEPISGQASCLRAPLFSLQNDYQSEPSSAIPSFDTSLTSPFEGAAPQHFAILEANHPPAVMVPSHAFFDEPTFGHGSTVGTSGSCLVGSPSSFQTSGSSLASYDIVEPHMSDDGYYGYSDAEGYICCKRECSDSPTPRSDRKAYSRSSTGAKTVKPIPPRSKRRGSKRQRKQSTACKQYRHGVVDVKVECELDMDENGRIKPRRTVGSEKKKICDVLLDNGSVCGQSFERSEHLKRHQLMHSDVKAYPCPLASEPWNCRKAISRSDNACDHFKTHLRRGKGKRNKNCEWEELEVLIRRDYSHEPAKKLVTNLERWLENERRKELEREREAELTGNEHLGHHGHH